MYNIYFVNINEQPIGEHEVHKEGCACMPMAENRRYIGLFDDANKAVEAAKNFFQNVDGCYYCSPEAHKR